MKQKKMYLGIIMLLFGLLNYTFASFNFSGLSDIFKTKLVGVHYKGGGNNFMGYLFVTGKKNLSIGENITIEGVDKKSNCQQKLRGYYFNPLQGNVLYPLDDKTKQAWKKVDLNNYKDLELSGGFYTACNGDINSVYGKISYKRKGKSSFSIYAGFELTGANKIEAVVKKTLQFVEKNGQRQLIGMIYDSTYGLGFVGGKVNTGWSKILSGLNNTGVSNYITAIEDNKIKTLDLDVDIDTVYGIGYIANLVIKGLANVVEYKNNNALLSYMQDAKKYGTLFTDTKVVNMGKILNIARKKANKLCEGKWNSEWSNTLNEGGKTICIRGDGKVEIITDDITVDGKKTNIVMMGKNSKLVVKKSQVGPGYINVFVDGGYVLFGSGDNTELVSIDKNGEYTENGGVTSGFIFNGNIIVNGLIGGNNGSNIISLFQHKMYIYGSIASLNTIGVNKYRKEYVKDFYNDMLGDGDGMQNYVDLQEVFSWECVGEKGIDGVKCNNTEDKYATQGLIIKKRQYENPILK